MRSAWLRVILLEMRRISEIFFKTLPGKVYYRNIQVKIFNCTLEHFICILYYGMYIICYRKEFTIFLEDFKYIEFLSQALNQLWKHRLKLQLCCIKIVTWHRFWNLKFYQPLGPNSKSFHRHHHYYWFCFYCIHAMDIS